MSTEIAYGTISRVAGTGIGGDTGDGGPATEAQLSWPTSVAVTSDGGFLIADLVQHVVRKVSPSGIINRVAGTGTAGNSGDGGPAIEAQLNAPGGLAATPDGGFLIADPAAHVVRKVSASGTISRVPGRSASATISRVAGTGTSGHSGDDGPATDAQLAGPVALALTPDGGFLIADATTHVVRKVSASGTITRVAGTYTLGNTGDDGPATDAQIATPGDLAVTADGGFLIVDEFARVVRKVSASGTITRVAGTGDAGNGGDDGPATDAQLDNPLSVAVTGDGGFLIGTSPVVRKVSVSGTITRVAGTIGGFGNSGDDGLAVEAVLRIPATLAVTADGGFLIGDIESGVVRKVSAIADPT